MKRVTGQFFVEKKSLENPNPERVAEVMDILSEFFEEIPEPFLDALSKIISSSPDKMIEMLKSARVKAGVDRFRVVDFLSVQVKPDVLYVYLKVAPVKNKKQIEKLA